MSAFWTLLLRFYGGVAKRELEGSVFVVVSSTHHNFLHNMCLVVIIWTFRVSVGEPFYLLCLLFDTLFEV